MNFHPFKHTPHSGGEESASDHPLNTGTEIPESELPEIDIPDADYRIVDPADEENAKDIASTDFPEMTDAKAGDTSPDSGGNNHDISDNKSDSDDHDDNDHALKKAGKKAAAAGAAGLAAISLMLGSAFSNPSEIINQTSPERERPAVVVQYEAQPDDDVIPEDDEEDKKKKSLKDIIRTAVYSLPLAARVLLVLPLWVLGYGLIAALTALYEPVIAPLLGVVIKWLLTALVLAASVFLITKAIAPDTPLSKIFSKRNLILILFGAAVLGAADFIAMNRVEGYEKWRNLASLAAGFLILAGFSARLLLSGKRKKAAA